MWTWAHPLPVGLRQAETEVRGGSSRRARLWGRIRESRPLRGQRRNCSAFPPVVGSCRLRYSPLTDSSPPSSAQRCAGSSWLVPAGASSARTLCRDRGGWSGGAAQRCTPLHSRLARRYPRRQSGPGSGRRSVARWHGPLFYCPTGRRAGMRSCPSDCQHLTTASAASLWPA